MGSKTVYRLVIRRRLPKPPAAAVAAAPSDPARPMPATHVDTVLTTHDVQGLAIVAFNGIVKTVGRAFGPYADHQLLLLPERVRQ